MRPFGVGTDSQLDDGTRTPSPKRVAGIAHVPKTSRSTSSQRIQACSIAAHAKLVEAPARSKQNKNKRAKQKAKKQEEYLLHVAAPPGTPKYTNADLDGCTLYLDGGDSNNPRIHPQLNNPKAKPMRILQICNGDLHVPMEHINLPGKGLTVHEEGGKHKPFILVPRESALWRTGLRNKPTISQSLFNSFQSVEIANGTSEGRGTPFEIIVEGGKPYCCVGSKARRAAVGVNEYHHAIAKIGSENQKQLYQWIKGVEHCFTEWVDTSIIRQVRHAMDLVSAKTFAVPNLGRTKIYSAFSCALNAYLNCHTDKDFTMGALSLHTEETYDHDDRIIAYFVFPLRSLAIPIRQGDILFFDPQEPHMLSSRCRNEDNIYCVSLYLKSNILGLNNNSLPLSKDLEVLAQKYQEYELKAKSDRK